MELLTFLRILYLVFWILYIILYPAGEFANLSLNDFVFKCRERLGDIYRLPGVIGQPDSVVLFNVDDFEKVYRTEGMWPSRPGTDAVRYYRQNRKDGFFKETMGLNDK